MLTLDLVKVLTRLRSRDEQTPCRGGFPKLPRHGHVLTGEPEHVTRSEEQKALSEQGFGILTEIGVRATFEVKLGADAADAVGDYVILGACNPALASRALAAEPALGALLPCNVVVRRSKDASVMTIEAIGPQTLVQLSDNPAVREVAEGRVDAVVVQVMQTRFSRGQEPRVPDEAEHI